LLSADLLQHTQRLKVERAQAEKVDGGGCFKDAGFQRFPCLIKLAPGVPRPRQQRRSRPQ
jgi:hypothetical protein